MPTYLVGIPGAISEWQRRQVEDAGLVVGGDEGHFGRYGLNEFEPTRTFIEVDARSEQEAMQRISDLLYIHVGALMALEQRAAD